MASMAHRGPREKWCQANMPNRPYLKSACLAIVFYAVSPLNQLPIVVSVAHRLQYNFTQVYCIAFARRITHRTKIINYPVTVASVSVCSSERSVCFDQIQTIWFSLFLAVFFSVIYGSIVRTLYVRPLSNSQRINFSNILIECGPNRCKYETEKSLRIHRSAFICKQNEYWTLYDL